MTLSAAFPVFSGSAAGESAFTCDEAVPGEELAATLSAQSASTEADGLIAYNLSYDTSVAAFTISMSASASKDRRPVSGGVTAPSCTVKVKEE